MQEVYSKVIRLLFLILRDCKQVYSKAIPFNNKSHITTQPLEKLVLDYLERSVKGLDVCNAIIDGTEQMRQWQKQLEIISCALSDQRYLGEAQFRRSKKALNELPIGMVDEKESRLGLAHRNRSFGPCQNHHKSLKPFRSLYWSVSRSWSASKQLQAMGNNIVPLKISEMIAINGLAMAVYTISNVLLLVMLALVAVIPCQDRGIPSHLNISKNYIGGSPMVGLQERILDESKKQGRRNGCGLLKEIQGIERFARSISRLTEEGSQLPEKKTMVSIGV